MNVIPLFHQLRFEYLFNSTLRSLGVLFARNFRGLDKKLGQKHAFLLFNGILGVFEADSNKKGSYFFSKLPTGDTRISHCRVFKTILFEELAQKLYKNGLKMKKRQISVFPIFAVLRKLPTIREFLRNKLRT